MLLDIFAVVTYSRRKNSYRLVSHLRYTTHCHVVSFRLIVYSAESVPEFNPPLVANFEFTSHKTFKNFLLTKCE